MGRIANPWFLGLIAAAAWGAVGGAAVAQSVVQAPEQVFTVEAVGGRTATGEVVAHVRAEPTSEAWAATHGFASWEAHFLIDCRQARLRQIRGATYPDRNLKGPPTPDKVKDGWLAPEPGQPGLQILGEACKPAAPRASAAELMLATAAKAVVAPPPPSDRTYDLHLARGPSEEGARRALTKATKSLADIARLSPRLDTDRVADGRRYIAVISGFQDGAAAWSACERLRAQGQTCYARDPDGRRLLSDPKAARAD